MKRDPRPVWQQVLSGLKIGAVLVAVGAGLLICWSLIPVHRIEAYVWHLRHGTTLDVDHYRIPVPKQWYVKDISENFVMLIDLNTGDGVSVETGGLPKRLTLSAWADLESRILSDTMKMTGKRDFHIAGEAYLCIERDVSAGITHLYPIECRSDGGLTVSFLPFFGVGRKHDGGFYSRLQQIQKF
jgi:hypothetical protein